MDLRRTILTQLLTGPLPLAELQAAADVSPPTLRRAVQELSDDGWIRVVGRAAANGGRPAMLFGLDPERYAVVGVHLQLPGLRLVTTDLAGAVLDRAIEPELLRPEPAIAAVADYIAGVRTRLPERELLGIGVALPGFLDLASGAVVTIGRVPRWDSLPLAERLQALVGLPTVVGNDIDCMALAAADPGDAARSYAYIGFDEGVKASMFLDGTLYEGPFGNAGLLSPSLLRVDAPARDVARAVTLHGVGELFAERAAAAADPPPHAEVTAERDPYRRFARILDLAATGDPVAAPVAELTTEALAVFLAGFVHLVQPALLVIGGALGSLPDPLFERLEREIRARLSNLLGNNLIVRRSAATSPDLAAVGAARRLLLRHRPAADPRRAFALEE